MACNEIVFGNIEPSPATPINELWETPNGFFNFYYSPNKYISNVEVHDDYTIGNSLATPYTPPLPSWYEWNGNSEVPLTDSGIMLGAGPTLDSSNAKKNIWDFGPWYNPAASAAVETPQREIVANGLPGFVSNPGDDDHFVKYTLPYVGSALASTRSLDLYIPQIDGIEAPENGWPVIVWVHGGYWLGGSRGDIFPAFLAWCLSKGYAVASVSYVLATAFIGAPSLLGLDQGVLDFLGTVVGVGGFPITKPSWDYTDNGLPRSGAARSGQFPSFFLDVKKATKYLQVNVAETYNLDPNKFVVTGHSAGGYNALAAATTRDLSLNGVDLSINNTDFDEPVTTNVIRHTGDDPIYAGAYSFAGPISIQLVWDYDPTHPYYGMIFTQADQTNPAGREGKLKSTARSFMGANYKSTPSFTGTSIPEFISANVAKCPPIGYCRGKYDYLIHWEHEQLLAQSCAANNVNYTSFANRTVHDFVQRNFPEGHFYNYLKSIGL
jgi:acetyl esterase/lipase